MGFFQNIKLYSVFFLSYLVFRFFVLVIFVFVSDHRYKEKETINLLCHSDISKMIFDNVFSRYLFILLLSVHLSRSQTETTGSSSEPSTGMLLVHFDCFVF